MLEPLVISGRQWHGLNVEAMSYKAVTSSPSRIQFKHVLLRTASVGRDGFSVHCPSGATSSLLRAIARVTLQRSSVKLKRGGVTSAQAVCRK